MTDLVFYLRTHIAKIYEGIRPVALDEKLIWARMYLNKMVSKKLKKILYLSVIEIFLSRCGDSMELNDV